MIAYTMCKGNSIYGLIERGSHILDGIRREISKRVRKIASSRLQFMDLMYTIGVRLNDMLVWFTTNKALNDSVEISDMRLGTGCPLS